MQNVKLGEICDFHSGNAWKADDFSDSGVPIIRINNLNQNEGEFVYWNQAFDKRYLVYKDDILLSLSGTIKVYKWHGVDALLNQRIVKINAKKGINIDWVYYKINQSIEEIINKAKNATIKNVSVSDIKNINVLLPDFETQNKIVAILDKAKMILDKREKTITQYDELLRATFLEMFGNPMERPNGWKIQPIQKCVVNISAGTSYGGEEKKELEEDELGVLKVSAVTKGIFNPNEYKAVKKEVISKNVLNPLKGDLLFSRANTLGLVGATCIVDSNYENLFLPDKIWKIETDESLIKKVYLHYVLQNKDVRKTFLSIATGSSGSMLNISMDKFRNIEIPYPPIELQELFEKKYFKYVNLKRKIQYSKSTIEGLQKSLSQLAFQGKGELKFGKGIDLEVLLENDYDFFKENSNIQSIQLLLERLDKSELNENKFYEQEIYDKAKGFAFELLKEGKINQVFDGKTKRVKLTV